MIDNKYSSLSIKKSTKIRLNDIIFQIYKMGNIKIRSYNEFIEYVIDFLEKNLDEFIKFIKTTKYNG